MTHVIRCWMLVLAAAGSGTDPVCNADADATSERVGRLRDWIARQVAETQPTKFAAGTPKYQPGSG